MIEYVNVNLYYFRVSKEALIREVDLKDCQAYQEFLDQKVSRDFQVGA